MTKDEMLLKINAKKQQKDQAIEATKIAEETKRQQDLAKLKTYESRIESLIEISETIRKCGYFGYIEIYERPCCGELGFETRNSSLPIEYLVIGGEEVTNRPKIIIRPNGTCKAIFQTHECKLPNNSLDPFFAKFDKFERSIYKIVEDFF